MALEVKDDQKEVLALSGFSAMASDMATEGSLR
jgi:hypothetical protein